MRNILYICLVIILIPTISISIIFYLDNKDTREQISKLSSNIDPEYYSDWPTYINTLERFSIKYPPTWKYVENFANCFVVFYSDEYPQITSRLHDAFEGDHVGRIGVCKYNKFFSSYQAKKEVNEFRKEYGWEDVLVGKSVLGVYKESPGAISLLFPYEQNVIELSLSRLSYLDQEYGRITIESPDRETLRTIYYAVVDSIVFD